KVVTRRNRNVTISCFPRNPLAPVLWKLEAICEADNEPLLHEYPQYFFFHPPSLRHTVTFNVETVTRSFLVTSSLHFNCGLVDANNDRNILSSRDITLYVQEETI
ncbi:hypothetical protein GBAR_LOCUS3127, partial [Geodia barretti]